MRLLHAWILIVICSSSIGSLGVSQTNLPIGVVIPLPSFTNNDSMAAFQSWRQSGIELMRLKNVVDGDVDLRYSRWIAPTSIVVDAVLYNVSTGACSSFLVVNADTSTPISVDGFLMEKENEQEARIEAFAEIAGSSSFTPDVVADRYSVNLFGTNLLRIASIESQCAEEVYQSRNLYIKINAPTNALDFAVAIINAGLPEGERIAVPTEEQ